MSEQNIIIYAPKGKDSTVEVELRNNNIWLSQVQMAELFDVSADNISLHLKNIYNENELDEMATTEESSVVRKEGKREVKRAIKQYNLDAIISVGYRVNSKKGTQFRIWANKILKEYLVEGYALNERKLNAQHEHIEQLEQALNLFKKNLIDNANLDEMKGLLDIITKYTRTFILLNQFDSQSLSTEGFNEKILYSIQEDEAEKAIIELRDDLINKGEATLLFGQQKDKSFAGLLGNIMQSFGGEYLYKSIEEQTAHLLYLVIKNHPFVDGNKRIGAFLFIWFLQRNKHHLKNNGELKINDNALAAIALLIAQSDPKEKLTMIHLIMNLIRNI